MTTRTLTGFIETLSVLGVDLGGRYRGFFRTEVVGGVQQDTELDVSWDQSADRFLDHGHGDQFAKPVSGQRHNDRLPGKEVVETRKGGFQADDYIHGDDSHAGRNYGSRGMGDFHTLASQRLDWARRRGVYPFLTALDIEEDLFNRPQSFGISYTLLTGLRNVIGDSGLWRPIGTTWERWAISLAGTAFSNRGSSRLLDIAADEAIVNLCTGDKIISPNNAQQS